MYQTILFPLYTAVADLALISPSSQLVNAIFKDSAYLPFTALKISTVFKCTCKLNLKIFIYLSIPPGLFAMHYYLLQDIASIYLKLSSTDIINNVI